MPHDRPQDRPGSSGDEDQSPTLTLREASWQYRVPLPTLRYWLDKGELTRARDEQGNILVSRAELERKLQSRAEDARRRTQGA